MGKNKNVTLSMNSQTYDKFVDYCKKEGYMISRRVEILLKKELNKNDKEKS